MLKTVTLPATTKNVGESLSTQFAQERLEIRQCFLKLLSCLKFLARQGLPATTKNVGESLSTQFAQERLEIRQYFLKLLSCLKFLARQGLPLRGSGTELDSNYMQLLYLRAEDDTRITDWVQKKTDKYTSGKMQNEMLKTMAFTILRKVALSLQRAHFYTVMVDETTDVNNSEQVLCFRWIDDEFEAHEEFLVSS